MKIITSSFLGLAALPVMGATISPSADFYRPQQSVNALVRLEDGDFSQERNTRYGLGARDAFVSGGGAFAQVDAVSRSNGDLGASAQATGGSTGGGSAGGEARSLTKIEVTSTTLTPGTMVLANLNFGFDGEIALSVANNLASSEVYANTVSTAGYEIRLFGENPLEAVSPIIGRYEGEIRVGFRPVEGDIAEFFNESQLNGATSTVMPLIPPGIVLGEGAALSVNAYEVTGSLIANLMVGEEYYVWQNLAVGATGDGGENTASATTDFLNTGSFEISDPNGQASFLLSQVVPVPEPAGGALLLLAGVISSLNRRR